MQTMLEMSGACFAEAQVKTSLCTLKQDLCYSLVPSRMHSNNIG